MKSSLSALRACVFLADLGSFTLSAQRMGISVPAVSKLVRGIESELGVQLFYRSTRSVALTEQGKTWVEHARMSLSHLQAGTEALSADTGAPRGTLRISAPIAFGQAVLLALLPEFRRKYPEITIDLVLEDRLASMVGDSVDVAIRGTVEAGDGFIARRLSPTPLITCAASSYLRKHGIPRTLDDLAGHQCICYKSAESGRVMAWEFDMPGRSINLAVPPSLCLNDGRAIAACAVAGMGIAQFSGFAATPLIRSRQLVSVLPQYTAKRSSIYLLFLRSRHLPPKTRVFVDFMMAQAKDIRAMAMP